MKLRIQDVCVFLMVGADVLADPVIFPPLFPQMCPQPRITPDVDIWEERADEINFFDYLYILSGTADMTQLSEFIAEKSTDFEDYMWRRKGNLQYLRSGTEIDEWKSMMWTLNVLTGPLLAAPYHIDRTNSNADDWDAWWNAIHDLTPYDRTSPVNETVRCDTDALQQDFKPKAIGFPVYLLQFLFSNIPTTLPLLTVTEQKSDTITGRVWDVSTEDLQSEPKKAIQNTGFLCDTISYTYDKKVSESTTTTTQTQVSDSLTVSTEMSYSTKASAKFGGIVDVEATSTIKTGLSNTFATAYTTTSSGTTSTTISQTWDSTIHIPPLSVVNVTVYTAQTQADVFIAGDVVYNEDRVGVKAWIQGDFIDIPTGEVSDLIKRGDFAALKDIKEAAKLAMKVIGADWSDLFLDSLISPTVSGKATSTAGEALKIKVNFCDKDSISGDICDEFLAEQFPPTIRECPPSGKRRSDDDGDFFGSASFDPENVLAAVDYDRDCFHLEPTAGETRTWNIIPKPGCTSN
eukprot:Clim_evm1s76 gene=Clim_evmTU1s76